MKNKLNFHASSETSMEFKSGLYTGPLWDHLCRKEVSPTGAPEAEGVVPENSWQRISC